MLFLACSCAEKNLCYAWRHGCQWFPLRRRHIKLLRKLALPACTSITLTMRSTTVLSLLALVTVVTATNIVLTNDDGWAVAQIRAQNTALKNAGYTVRTSFKFAAWVGIGMEADTLGSLSGHSVCACRKPVRYRLLIHHAVSPHTNPQISLRI